MGYRKYSYRKTVKGGEEKGQGEVKETRGEVRQRMRHRDLPML